MSKSKKTEAETEAQYVIGDKVVHPAHGAGVVAAIEQPDILDDFNRYYVIELTAQEMRIMVPMRSADDLGVRRVITQEQSEEIYDILRSEADDLPDDFKERQSHLGDRLKEGDVEELARVVRDMGARSFIKTYSPTESRLYEQARTMLSGELALATDSEVDQVLELIDQVLLVHEPTDD